MLPSTTSLTTLTSVATALALAALSACSSNEKAQTAKAPENAAQMEEEVTTTSAPPRSYVVIVPPAPTPPASQTTTTSGEVKVSPDVMKECEAKFNEADNAPKFQTSKSDLKPEDQEILQKIATCVTTGPLKGRTLSLVGHTDPRGSAEYNQTLGEQRADSVATYLKNAGVPESSVTTSSRGKLDASGTEESTWSQDRRVDVDLK